jgi:prophage maintenance system killer protein
MNTWEIKIYETNTWNIDVQVNFKEETVWLESEQIAIIFWRDRSTIQRHIKTIYKRWELDEKTTCAKNAQVQIEWWRRVKREKNLYNFDLILAVWYITNSKEAINFRKWVSNVLKQYLVSGYAVNQKRLQEKWFKELENTLNLVKKAISSWDIWKEEALWLLDIITKYTNTWLFLQKYDENDLENSWKTKKLNYKLEAKEALESLLELKKDLIKNWQATELFARERQNWWLEWIFWNIYQTFDGNELYETIEEKAANLLYFIVKDHPFSDWNKRSWAFLFILFLAKNNILFDENKERKINDRALVAITLLIAESDPKDKDIMVKLVLNLVN